MAIKDTNSTKNNPSKLSSTLSPNTLTAGIRSGGTDSVLASMFLKILYDLGINETRWNHLMTNYVMDKRNCIPANNRDQSSARGNLQKELLKRKMTWKVFCKGIRFLNITKFDFVIRAHHANGKITEHTKSVSFGEIMNDSQSHEDDKDKT